MNISQFRVARPTNDVQKIITFYRDGLGLQVLGHFQDHEGFDGVMLGLPEMPYHLEFTREHGHVAAPAPSRENLLVFYLADRQDWETAVERMKAHGFMPTAAQNPYWDRGGVTFEDFEGYRVVLYWGTWPRAT